MSPSYGMVYQVGSVRVMVGVVALMNCLSIRCLCANEAPSRNYNKTTKMIPNIFTRLLISSGAPRGYKYSGPEAAGRRAPHCGTLHTICSKVVFKQLGRNWRN